MVSLDLILLPRDIAGSKNRTSFDYGPGAIPRRSSYDDPSKTPNKAPEPTRGTGVISVFSDLAGRVWLSFGVRPRRFAQVWLKDDGPVQRQVRMNDLHPPLVLVECDGEEFTFFGSLEEVLDDRFDILWGNAYDGWDATGQYFSLVRCAPPRRWWHSLLAADRSFLAIEHVRPGFRVAEAEQRIRRLLNSDTSDFAGLLAEGLRHPLFGKVRR